MIRSVIAGLVGAASLLLAAPTFALDAPTDAPAAMALPGSYLLGAGDQLRITVFGEPELSGAYTVSSSGVVSLPLAGDVPAAGLSITDFQSRAKAALEAGYLKEAKISVEVASFRPFYILGEVEKPGAYPYSAGLTVLNAVATAGGFTYRANTHTVYVKHSGETAEEKYPLTSGTTLSAGDTIRIGERYF